MLTRSRYWLSTAALWLVASSLCAQGKLAQIKEQVHPDKEEKEEKKEKARRKAQPHHTHQPRRRTGGDTTGFVYFQQGADYGPAHPQVIVHDSVPPVATAPVIVEQAERPELFFPRYPYAPGNEGYLVEKLPSEVGGPGGNFDYKTWAARVGLEVGNDFDGLNRTRVKLRLDNTAGFGIQSRFNFFHEQLNRGRTDELFINTTDVLFHLIRERDVLFYVGVGFNLLSDRYVTELGFNFTAGVDVFPIKPLVISAALDVGSIDRVRVIHGRATIGVMLNRFEIFAGFDYRQIGCVDLFGPLIGAQLWF